MELQNINFPKQIFIDVPKGRKRTIAGQTFSTNDLPDRLQATFEGVENERRWWSEVSLVKYSVEPIFNLRIPRNEDAKGNYYYNVEDVIELCSIIVGPGMEKIRNAIPKDKFVEKEKIKQPYWLCDSEDKYHLTFVKEGKIWKTSVIGCTSGYYYECYTSKEETWFKKVGSKANLFQESMPVRPVVFFDARAFVKSQETSFAFA